VPVGQPVDPRLADVGQLGDGDGGEVQCDRDRLAVEISAAHDSMILGEHDGVVGH